MEFLFNTLKGPYENLIEILIVGFIFYFIERINPAEKNVSFFKDDLKNEAFLAFINLVLFIPVISVLIVIFINMALRPLLGEQMLAPYIESLPLIAQILLGVMIVDFSTYWRHRFTHFYMWSYHSVHHSARNLTWITGLRLHPIDLLAAAFLDGIILYLMGFGGAGFLGTIILIKVMNYFTHANLNIKFEKPLRYIIASPHYHRWHHATQPAAYNKNFCGACPLWDILFGTYYHPEDLPPAMGLSPNEQKNFPEFGYVGWLTYPFKREYKRLKKLRMK